MTFIGVPSDAQLRARWKLLVGIGIVILILGLIALWNVVDATLVTVAIVGVMVLLAGIAQIIGAFMTGGSTGRRVLLGLLGVLYVIVGFNILADPLRGAVALTLFIAIMLIVDGVIRLIGAFSSETQHRGLMAIVAVINILLGIWLWTGIPVSGLAIGLFVGLQLVFAGLLWIVSGFVARSLPETPTAAGATG
jgi:uncharacterized membrane protein HdeD (DUF308 family)